MKLYRYTFPFVITTRICACVTYEQEVYVKSVRREGCCQRCAEQSVSLSRVHFVGVHFASFRFVSGTGAHSDLRSRSRREGLVNRGIIVLIVSRDATPQGPNYH